MSRDPLERSLRELDEARRPDEATVHRVGQGVRDRLVQRSRTPRRSWLTLAVAGAGALVVLAALLAWPRGPQVVDRPLAAERSEQVRLGDEVRVVYEGHGQAIGNDRDLTIHWEQGTLHTEVTPQQGVSLRVQTDEASVRVVGTIFEVRRDALGTEVAVHEGRVELRCRGEEAAPLGAGEQRLCFRSSEAALQACRQAPSAERVLAVIERGLTLDGSPASHRELELRRVVALRALERPAEALAVAQSYLDAGHQHRRAEMLRIASELAYEQLGCSAALPLLDELATSPDAPPAALEQRARCSEGTP